MFTNLTIKARNIILACVVILGLTAIHTTAKIFNDKEKKLLNIRMDITSLKEEILTLRKNEKDFLMRNDIKYEKALLESATKLSEQLQLISKTVEAQKIKTSELVRLEEVIHSADQMAENTTLFEGLITQSTEVSHKIETSVGLMGNAIGVVSLATHTSEETGREIKEIVDEINEINHITSSNARDIEEIAGAAEHLHSVTQKLNDQLHYFKV